MKTDELAAALGITKEELLGHRRAHLAALLANMRMLLARSMTDDDPVIGLHGVYLTESGQAYYISSGATPPLQYMLTHLGGLQGQTITNYVARQLGDRKQAMTGDQYDHANGKTHCVGCDDGDPTGEHAKKELEGNAKAWLGIMVVIAGKYYGEHLSPRAIELLRALASESLPADTQVS